jgi:hypothetical protein
MRAAASTVESASTVEPAASMKPAGRSTTEAANRTVCHEATAASNEPATSSNEPATSSNESAPSHKSAPEASASIESRAAVEAIRVIAVEPRAGTYEQPAHEPVRAVVAVGSATIGSVGIVAIRAGRRTICIAAPHSNSYAKPHLGMRSGGRRKGANCQQRKIS